jgi:hypothetical protein
LTIGRIIQARLDGANRALFEESVGKDQRDHCFAHHRRRRDGAYIAPFDRRRRRRHGQQIHRAQRLHQRRDGFHACGNTHVLAVRHATFEAAGVVRRPRHADRRPAIARFPGDDFVMHARARQPRRLEAPADRHRLDRRDRHERVRETAI